VQGEHILPPKNFKYMKTYLKTISTVIFGTILMTVVGCQSKTERAADEVKDEQKDVAEAQKDVAEEKTELNEAQNKLTRTWAEERDELKRELNEDVAQIDSRITTWETDMKNANAEAKENYRKAIADLREERNQVNTQLKRTETATEANWNEMKKDIRVGADKANAKLKRAGQDIKNYFNN
jgi:predicted  nucleic acid-binding Zn-ribbon protein